MQNFSLLSKNSIYTCTVADIKAVKEPNVQIFNIYGTHFNGSKNENVHAVMIESKDVNFFPKALEAFFSFLSVVSVVSSNLTVIRQTDLLPFTNLRLLNLHDNEIEFLSRDLFVYNPNLEVIILSMNEISNMDPDVFDYLNNLRYLNLESNDCISDAESDRNGVKILITGVKEKCNNCDIEEQKNLQLSFDSYKISCSDQLEDLRADLAELRAQNFEITRQAQMLNGNLSMEIDRLMVKMAERKINTNRRIFILTVMLIIMCILLIVFTAVIVYFIFNAKSYKEKSTKMPEIVEFSSRTDEIIAVRRTHGKHRLSENLYEDINNHERVMESGMAKFVWI